jgi:hypothetical protein
MFGVGVNLRNFLDVWATGNDPDDIHRLYLVLDSTEEVNPYIIGKFYDSLFRIHPRLPVTFYHRFGWSCRKWFRIYDFSDLEYEIEMLTENMDFHDEPQDDEEVQQTANLQAWKAQIPPYMKCKPLPDKDWNRIVAGLGSHSKIRKVLELTTELYKVSRSIMAVDINQDERDSLDNCGNSCPVFSLHFYSMDALRGLLDDETRMVQQTSPAPHAMIPFDVADGKSILHAFKTMAVAVKVVALAAAITHTLPGSD